MKSTSILLRALEKEPIQHFKGLMTGFSQFDKFTKGLQPGQLIVIAGRPGMGSHAFTKCLLLNTSIRHHNSVAVFSLEQTAEKYLQQMIATEAGISNYELNRGNHSQKIIKKLKKTKKRIVKAPILINDNLEFSLSALTSKIFELTSTFHHIKLFVIHGYYLLTHNTVSKISRQQELDIISQKLKHVAENLNITLIITHELPDITNYNSDEDIKPSLKELYNDTPITKYADLAMYLYRPEYYGFKIWYDTNESCECETELVIAKNRHGYIDSFRLFFDGHRSIFNEIGDERFEKKSWIAKG